MQPSRRATLRLAAGALAAPVAGCVAPGTTGTDGDPTGDDPTGDAEAGASSTLDVGLVGPDADRAFFDAGDVARVGSVTANRGGQPSLRVVLTHEATAAAAGTAREVGLADAPDEFEVVVRRDGEAVSRFGVAPGFAEAVADREWEGELPLLFGRRERAAELRDALTSGG